MVKLTKYRRPNTEDKIALAAALKAAGICARIRVFPNSLRLCWTGEPRAAIVANVLNDLWLCDSCGQQWDPSNHSFTHREINIHLAA